VNWTLTSVPQRFSVKIAVPAILGNTLGTAGNDYLAVGVCLPVRATFTVNDAQWQLESCPATAPAAGSPSSFEFRGPQQELSRVQRYWETGTMRSYTYESAGVVAAISSNFSATKRTVPSCSLVNITAANCGAAGTVYNQYANGLMWGHTTTATGVADFTDTWTADARL
jgi:hypothetical protein